MALPQDYVAPASLQRSVGFALRDKRVIDQRYQVSPSLNLPTQVTKSVAHFDNVRVESVSFDTATIRWSYSGANAVSIYRALHGGSFSLIITFPVNYESNGVSASPFTDDSVAAATYYDYKLSDDGGVTFSATVSVTTQKQFPIVALGGQATTERVDLPVFDSEEDINPQTLQQTSDILQDFLNGPSIAAPRTCFVCPENGAIILDCSTGCFTFDIDVDQPIKSISINCTDAVFKFRVRGPDPIEICGFPDSLETTGDECFEAPVDDFLEHDFTIVEPEKPCPHPVRRVPATPCVGDYTRDCYDLGSLTWSGVKFNFTYDFCDPGQFDHYSTGTGSARIRSGNLSTEPRAHPMAGFSLLYTTEPAGSTRGGTSRIRLKVNSGGSPIKGLPRFGVAIHVPETATVDNFTGTVALLDYASNLAILGEYVNANLRNGISPGVIGSTSIPADTAWLRLNNVGFAFGNEILLRLSDSSGATVGEVSSSGRQAPAGRLGIGFFWIGNLTKGLHETQVGWDVVSPTINSLEFIHFL